MSHKPETCTHEIDGRSLWTDWEPRALPDDGSQRFTRECLLCHLVEDFMPRMVLRETPGDLT